MADKLMHEAERLATFEHLPESHIWSATELARAGFSNVGVSDKVKCESCKNIQRAREFQESPATDHKLRFPQCAFVFEENAHSPKIQPASTSVTNAGNVEQESVVTSGPIKPIFKDYRDKINPVSKWPPPLQQSTRVPSEAGLVYTGSNDAEMCFECRGSDGGKNWPKDADPCEEYILHSPQFRYLPDAAKQHGQAMINSASEGLSQTHTYGIRSQRTQGGPAVSDRAPYLPPNTEMSYQNADHATQAVSPSTSDFDIGKFIRCKECHCTDCLVVFYPCQHAFMCEQCSLRHQCCPSCKRLIKSSGPIKQRYLCHI